VIFVTGFDSPLTEAEAGLLADASRDTGRLFLVLNKRDLAGDRDAGQVQDFVLRRLGELGVTGPRVYGLSALEALEGVTGNDRDRVSASGVAGFRADLELFLTADKTRLFLDNLAGSAARLVSAQRRDMLLGLLTRDRSAEVPEIMADFGARMEELAARQRAAAAAIGDRAGAGLPGLMAARSTAWRQELRELLSPLLSGALPAGDGDTARTVLEAGRAVLERSGREVTGSWLRRKGGEVHELLTGLAGGEIGVLLEASRAPGGIGARLAGLTADGDQREPAGWSAEDRPDLAVRAPGWSVPLDLPRRLPRKGGTSDPQVRRYLADALAAAVTAFEEQARTRFAEAALDWTARLEDQAGRQLTAAADWFRHCVSTPPGEEDLAALDDLGARLAAFRTGLAGASPAEEAPAPVTANGEASPAGRGGCTVCAQLEETLTGQLRRGQFLLATRDADQARLTRAGGYCPVHTWQYASIASPLGISAGYAKLAAAVAGTLESLARDDRAPPGSRPGRRRHLPRPGGVRPVPGAGRPRTRRGRGGRLSGTGEPAVPAAPGDGAGRGTRARGGTGDDPRARRRAARRRRGHARLRAQARGPAQLAGHRRGVPRLPGRASPAGRPVRAHHALGRRGPVGNAACGARPQGGSTASAMPWVTAPPGRNAARTRPQRRSPTANRFPVCTVMRRRPCRPVRRGCLALVHRPRRAGEHGLPRRRTRAAASVAPGCRGCRSRQPRCR